MPKPEQFAWFNAVVHIAGLCFALAMRGGTPLVPLDERMAWLASDPLTWKLGWTVWMLAALCVGGLYALLHGALGKPALGVWAVALACAGAAIDIFSEIIYITVLPGLAASGQREVFTAFERAAFGGGCILANGFYTLGCALLTIELKKRARTPLLLDLGALVTIVCGLAMSVAGVMQSARVLEILTGPTIVGFCLWGLAAARHATTNGGRP